SKEVDQPPCQTGGAAPCPKGTVLLVEDEEGVRRLVRQVLQTSGYDVLEARHGMEALQLWDAKKDEVRLMVTDVVMPEMNGSDLAQRLLSQRPDLKVLFISGYTDVEVFSQGLLDRGAALLPKPFMPKALSSKVDELLCGSTTA